MREINLGRVTAYADAVNAGYTGTREEFAVDLANAATYAAEAGDSAAEAKASEDAAALSASTAAQAAVEAAGSEDAVHADAVAAQAAKTDAIAAKDTAVSKAGEAANSASAAGLSAAAASASETAAGAYANTASSSATSAIGSASAAAESASAAEDSATEAASALGDVTAAKTEALAAIQTKGEETLESIPEDYTTLRNDVSSLKSDLTSSIDYLADNGYKRIYPTWEVGSIDSTSGDDTASSTNVRSIGYIDKNAIALWKIGERTGSLYVYRYDYADGVYTFLGRNQRTGNGVYTAWLKGLSGTHVRFVSGQNDVDYPNTWMTLCLHTQIGDDIENLKQSADKADFLYNQFGYYEKSFDVTAGVNHLSSSDLLTVDIKQNAKFRVVVSGTINAEQIYAYYNDGTNSRLATSSTYNGTAQKDIVGIGVYISGTNIPADTTVNVTTYQEDGLYSVAHYGISKNIITSVLGAELPDDLTEYGVTIAYANKMREVVTAWMSAYAGDSKVVPFILHTDQHGRLSMANKGIFDLLAYIVNWYEVSAIFNLGDTVVDHWENDNTNPNPLLRNGTLETALKCLANIPADKQINIYGNHDTWYSGDVTTAVSGVLPSLQYLNPYFRQTGLRVERNTDNRELMIIYDDKNLMKYLVVTSWDYADKTQGETGYNWYYINAAHRQWIIDKLTEDTGHDMVIVSHIPLAFGSSGAYDPITTDSRTLTNPVYIIHYSTLMNVLWNARKNKTSGTLETGETFDFTNCKDNLLCAISGHLHYDGVDYVAGASDGLLQTVFDWFTDLTIHFGLLDRRNNKIKVWKLHNESNTPGINLWEAPFTKPET